MLGVIGDVVQDVVVWPLEQVRPASDTRSDISLQRGGSAANVAAFAAPRYPTRFIGCVGDDPGGVALRQELTDRGADVRLQVRGRTGTIVVLVGADGERAMFPSRGACAQLETVDPSWLAGLELLHVTAYSFDGGSTPGAVLDAIRTHRARGGKVSIDIASAGLIENFGVPYFLDLLGQISPDFVSGNSEECVLLGLADGAGPGPNLTRLGAAVLLARAGERPTQVFAAGTHIATVAVPPVSDVRDVTGAGDAFNAGFLAAQVRGLVGGCEAGHALAARVLRSPGATEPD